MVRTFTVISGVLVFQDDILIQGANKNYHKLRLFKSQKLRNRVESSLIKKKCEFYVPKVTFLGHTFSRDGLQVDPDKLKAITSLQTPTNKSPFNGFWVCLITCLISYPINLTCLPLRSSIKKDSVFIWYANSVRSCQTLKKNANICSGFSFLQKGRAISTVCGLQQYRTQLSDVPVIDFLGTPQEH